MKIKKINFLIPSLSIASIIPASIMLSSCSTFPGIQYSGSYTIYVDKTGTQSTNINFTLTKNLESDMKLKITVSSQQEIWFDVEWSRSGKNITFTLTAKETATTFNDVNAAFNFKFTKGTSIHNIVLNEFVIKAQN